MSDKFASEIDFLSYAMGMNMGEYLTRTPIEVNTQAALDGVRDFLAKSPKISQEEYVKAMQVLQAKMQAAVQKQVDGLAAANIEAEKKFMAENGAHEGVKTTASGLQYEVIAEGKGDKPRVEDVVTVNYVGSFIDGKEFENTWQTKEPARFVMMSVIPGLAEGVALMTPGSRYRFTVPAELAYGHDGAGQIPPESALVFDLQLVKVEKVGAHQQSFGMPGMSGGMSKEMMEKMNPHK